MTDLRNSVTNKLHYTLIAQSFSEKWHLPKHLNQLFL